MGECGVGDGMGKGTPGDGQGDFHIALLYWCIPGGGMRAGGGMRGTGMWGLIFGEGLDILV